MPDTRHPFFAAKGPLVFAHRGGSGLAPENTFAAFDQGLALGADGIELDVHLSRDGVVMVHHDYFLERTTNLRGRLSDRTAQELAEADAGYQFRRDHTFPFRGKGFGIPTLAEVLARYGQARVIIELKGSSLALAQAVVRVVRQANAVARVCLGGFELRGLRRVRLLEPGIATSAARVEVVAALLRLWCRRPLPPGPYGGFQVPERVGRTQVVTPRFVQAARQLGLPVQVWTVDRAEVARSLLTIGVHALITDRPDVIVPLCRERGTDRRDSG